MDGSLFRVGGGLLPIAGEARDEDVFDHSELRKQVLLLENEAERVVAKCGGLFLGERGNVLVANFDGAGRRAVECAEEIEKRRFPASGRTDDGGCLAGGEKLRTAVARALINRPKLILADEPTGSLDPASTDTVADLLLALNRDHGVTLIVVTHNVALARRMGKTFELRSGKLGES